MSFLLEMWAYMRFRRKFFLIPVLLMTLLIGGLLLAAQNSVLAPFIYTLF